MGRLALIGGHSILGVRARCRVRAATASSTLSGPVVVHERGDQVLLQRHGFEDYTTAAKVDHARNFAALTELGCDRVLAVGSVGGLRTELGVGTFLCPDDFIALHLGLSLSDQHGGERVPGFDPGLEADRSLDLGRRRRARGDRRRRLLAGDRAAVRDAGRDPPDRRPRRRDRHDDRLRVHHRRRARHSVRGRLRGRQPRQRPRRPAPVGRGVRGRQGGEPRAADGGDRRVAAALGVGTG